MLTTYVKTVYYTFAISYLTVERKNVTLFKAHNLAYIDYTKCKFCRKCVAECPTGAIVEFGFPARKPAAEVKPEAPKAAATPKVEEAPKAAEAVKVEVNETAKTE